MSFSTARMILPVSAEADQVKIDVSNSPENNPGGWNSLFVLVGLVTTERVAVQLPRVENPHPTNDDHWTPWMQKVQGVQGLVAVELSVDNPVIRIPSALIVRLVKDAGVAGNEYGVRWM